LGGGKLLKGKEVNYRSAGSFAPWPTVRILAIQIAAAFVAVAPVFYFKL
jgi:hypothetical protein